MEAHQERVVNEKAELDEKIAKLKLFIDGPIFAGLHHEEQFRLQIQVVFMDGYSEVLGQRIGACR